MRLSTIYNLPFATLARGYQIGSRFVHSKLHIAVSLYLAKYEADHYGEIRARYYGKKHNYGGPEVGARMWKKWLPAYQSVLWGLFSAAVVLEIRTGGGALPLSADLMKYSLCSSGGLVFDTLVYTRCLCKPTDKKGTSNHYELKALGQDCSRREIAFAVYYFLIRSIDSGMCAKTELIDTVPRRLPMVSLLTQIGKFGVITTWKLAWFIAKLPSRLLT